MTPTTLPDLEELLGQSHTMQKRWAEISEAGDDGNEPMPTMLAMIKTLTSALEAERRKSAGLATELRALLDGVYDEVSDDELALVRARAAIKEATER